MGAVSQVLCNKQAREKFVILKKIVRNFYNF